MLGPSVGVRRVQRPIYTYIFYYFTRGYTSHVINIAHTPHTFRSQDPWLREYLKVKDFHLFSQPRVPPSRDQDLQITLLPSTLFLGDTHPITAEGDSEFSGNVRAADHSYDLDLLSCRLPDTAAWRQQCSGGQEQVHCFSGLDLSTRNMRWSHR